MSIPGSSEGTQPAGCTTFFTMAYIIVVNPGILSDAIFLEAPGDLFPQIAVATSVSAALGTLLMGLVANYPFALAPGMGINALFTYSVVLGLILDWKLALGCVRAAACMLFISRLYMCFAVLRPTVPNPCIVLL